MILKSRDSHQRRITSTKLPFKLGDVIGGGTFGTVYRVKLRDRDLAVKKYTYAREPVHITTIREIKALRSIKSPYVLQIEEIVVEKYQLYLVFKYYKYDLSKMIADVPLSLSDVKEIFTQMIKGVQDIHNAGYLHRDLKPANILIEIDEKESFTRNAHNSEINKFYYDDNAKKQKTGESKTLYNVKICDFGMSKLKTKEMTPGVVTLWYRPPELLLGCTNYNESSDIWSLGCMLAEMVLLKPLFKGSCEAEQLEIISSICGSINSDSMPQAPSYEHYLKYNIIASERKLREKLHGVSEDAVDLIDKMLVLDPTQRISIVECFDHKFMDVK